MNEAHITATSIVPPEPAGRAIAIVGCATVRALGMPVGTLLGQALGWRASFVAIVMVGVGVLMVATVVLPSVPTSHEARPVGQLRHAFAPRVVAILALCCLVFAGVQFALTYLVPYLDEVACAAATGFLLLYGVSTSIGSASGGRFADAGAERTLIVGTIGVVMSLLAMHLFGESPAVLALAVVGIGLFGMGSAPAMQHRVVTLTGPGTPLASSLPASAVSRDRHRLPRRRRGHRPPRAPRCGPHRDRHRRRRRRCAFATSRIRPPAALAVERPATETSELIAA